MKNKKLYSILGVLAMAVCLGIGVNANAKGHTDYAEQEYSEILAEKDMDDISYDDKYAADGDMEEVVDDFATDEIYEVGEDILITNAEVEQYEEYYDLGDSANPKQDAIDYAQERNALYAAAIENGFTVTDEEIYAYLDELKTLLKQEENKEMYENAISGFESEEAYWEFEYEVYKIDLPIQKYVASLEEEYKETSDVEDAMELEEEWTDEFEIIKEELVDEQNFTAIE
ncbi:MAG: hypothetical protein J6A75_09810 [Lachnospiraceae bacterium]|nr:hypothetical protein [Lachnospiraceae bacterium]